MFGTILLTKTPVDSDGERNGLAVFLIAEGGCGAEGEGTDEGEAGPGQRLDLFGGVDEGETARARAARRPSLQDRRRVEEVRTGDGLGGLAATAAPPGLSDRP